MYEPCKFLMVGAVALFAAHGSAYALPSFDRSAAPMVSSYLLVSEGRDEAAEGFVNRMASDAIGFLSDASISDAQKQQRFSKLLNRSFDMSTIGRFALGRYWRSSSPQQRDDYQKLFREMIVEVYSRRFGEYNGQALNIKGSRQDGKDITVNSVIVPKGGGQDIQVDWRVRNKGGKYKVIDIIVEGVSMALTQRSDFSSVIQRGGGDVSVLLDHLRQE